MRKLSNYFSTILISSCMIFSCNEDTESPHFFKADISRNAQAPLVNMISNEPEFTYTEFNKKEYYNFNVLKFGDIKEDSKYNWKFDLTIPDITYLGEGEYTLEALEKPTLENINTIPIIYFEKTDSDSKQTLSGFSHAIENQNGKFELYDETEASIKIKFKDIELGNRMDDYRVVVSGDLLIRKKQQ